MQDSTQSIMQSAKRFFSGTMLSRATGLLRDMSMAYAFGTQEAVAAFLVAFRLAHLLRRLFGEGALQSAFIPQFEQLRQTQPERASTFFRDLTFLLSAGLMLIIALCMAGLGGFWAWGGLSSGNEEIVFLTMLLMPSLLFICLFGINASLLQCEKSYFLTGVAPVAFNIIWAIGVLSLSNYTSAEAMPWLALWVIAACFGQWAITLPEAWKIVRLHCQSVWRGVQLFSPEIRQFAKPLMLGILGVAATQVNNAMDAIFARYADPEGPALLWYALRIQQLPLALFGIAISGALLPPLTRALKANDFVHYRAFLEFALRRTIALILPITAALFVLGDSCIMLLYGRGDFDNLSILRTTQCLWGYGAGLLPMALVLMLAPAFYAQGNLRTPAIGAAAAMIMNIVLNFILIGIFEYGAASVAIATSVSALGNVMFLAYALTDVYKMASRSLMISFGKVCLVSAVANLSVVAVDVIFLGGNTALQIMHGDIPSYQQVFLRQLLRFGVQFTTFTIVLFGVARMLKADDLLGLVSRRKPQPELVA